MATPLDNHVKQKSWAAKYFPLWIAFFAALVGFGITFAYYGLSSLKNSRAVSHLVLLQVSEGHGPFTRTPQPPVHRGFETAMFVAPINAVIYFFVTFWILVMGKLLCEVVRGRWAKRQVANLEHP